MPTAEQLRNKQQTYFDDMEVGQELPTEDIGPMTTVHAFRWSAAIENWHRIHYDQDFALYHEGLPNVLIHGSWKQSIMPKYLKDFCLPNGWMWKVSFQHRAMIVPGDTITCWGVVTKKFEKDGLGFLELQTGMRVQTGIETCPGVATIVLPIRGGREVPYPFVPPKDD
ncbi:MAG: MaoC family dehydratase [SAR202 cluster bacterium]|nr:MaoC family dehydratase [SAR202 cluster bacterium]MDP6714246.1 MaoC family dehydratase [SAR202 cluster bacterium]